MAPPPGDAEASVARLNKLQALASRRAPPLRSKNGGLGHATAAASQCSAAPIRSQAPAGAAAAIGSTTLGSSGGGTAAAELTRQEALAQNARLEGANRHLRERLADALEELDASHAQLRILQGLQQQLEDGTPGATELVAAALEQERALQAARDAHVLQLLRAKDEVIESFEARYAEARAELGQLRGQLEAAQQAAGTSGVRVRELVEANNHLRREAEHAAATAAEAEAELRGDAARLQGEVGAAAARLQTEAAAAAALRQEAGRLQQQLEDARAELAATQRQQQTLYATVDAANEAIEGMQAMVAEQERLVAERDAQVQSLQAHLAQLLGMPQEDAPALHRARFADRGGQPPDQAAASRIAALEAANERLEAALVEATRSAAAAGGRVAAEPSTADSEQDAVGVLEARLAVTSGRLQAAEERVEQLEKLLKVAEAAVLHNEVQLQDTLEGRLRAEEQVHSLRLELEGEQALKAQLEAQLAQLTAAQQSAAEDAAAVRGALQAACAQAAQAEAESHEPQQSSLGSMAAHEQAEARISDIRSSSDLGQEVSAIVSQLVQRIRSLEQEAASRQPAAAPAVHAAGVQCGPELSDAAVQSAPAEAGDAATTACQTSAPGSPAADAAGSADAEAGDVYGRPEVQQQQQQLVELTAALADARLAAVAAKAEQAAAEGRLQEAERKLEQEQEALAAAESRLGARGPDCGCQTAQQLRSDCSQLQEEVDALRATAAAARRESEVQLAEAAARAQALQAQVAALEGSKCELRELRSSAYAAVHRLQSTLREHGVALSEPPEGCPSGTLPQQLKAAVDGLLGVVQEHGELLMAFQQQLHAQPHSLGHSAAGPAAMVAPGPAACSSSSAMPAAASERIVIRSLAAQVASLQQRLEQAAGGAGDTGSPGAACWWAQAVPAAAAGDLAQLAGMLAMLRDQLGGLERIQQQLEASWAAGEATSASAPGAASPGASSAAPFLPSTAHTAALLGTELPSLRATVEVMEAEARRIAAEAGAAAAGKQAGPCGAPMLRLSGPAHEAAGALATAPGAAGDMARRKEKWKARCKEVQAQLAAATTAAQQVEAALQAQLADAERSAAEHARTVQALQERVEELATAGAQLEGMLQETARQLTESAAAAEAAQLRLQQQERQQEQAMREADERLSHAQGELAAERQQHAALVASLQDVVAGLQSSGDAEQLLRQHLTELAERVAVLTAAQEAAKAEADHKQAALDALQQELGAAHAECAGLAAGKQQREAELVGRLEAMQRECGALLGVVERAEEQVTEMESRMQSQLALLASRLDEHGDEAAAHVPRVQAALGRLQSAAEALDVRLLRVEAQAAVAQEDRQAAAVGAWAGLLRSRRYHAAVKHLRDGLQAQLLDSQAACQQQAAQLRQQQAALEAAQAKCAALASQLQQARLEQQHALEQAAGRHHAELAALHEQAEQQRAALHQQAEASAAAAAAEAEQRCRVEAAARACQAEQRALADLELAEQQCQGLQAELASVRAEFKRYQAMKAVEVRLLEQRVMQQLCSGGKQGGGGGGGKQGGRSGGAGAGGPPPGGAPGEGEQQPATVAELQAACGQEGIAAALREAMLERLAREQLEAALGEAQDAGRQLEARARAAETELAAHRGRHAGEARQVRERAERLAAELAESQQALKLAKSEGARRLKELQALQRQASENSGANGAAAAQLDGERRAREAAEVQLREARQSLARKAALIRDLKAKVDGLEQELAQQDPVPLLGELESCQARLRQAQAACGSKEAALRELRERLEQQTRLAHQQGVLEERETQQAAVRQLSQQLAEREAHVQELHSQLKQMHSELSAASDGLQATAASHTAAAEGAAARLEAAGRCAQQLMAAVRLLLEMLEELGAAVAAAADREACDAQADASAIAAAAGSIAGVVDLAPDDIRSVLMPPEQQPGGVARDLSAAAQRAWAVLQQAEEQLGTGGLQSCAPLLDAVGELRERCGAAQAALGAARVGCSEQAAAGARLGVEGLEQRLAAAAADIAELEARLG